jgi:hypothetical protein
MFTAFQTRFAEMADVFSRCRWGSRWSWAGLLGGLAGLFVLIDPLPAPGQPPASKSQATGKTGQAKDAPAEQAGKDEAPVAPDVAGALPVDPAHTRRVAPVEVFKDPLAEEVLDISKLMPVQPAPFTNEDVLRVKEMAQNPNLPVDRSLIDRVVRGLAARLTDKKSIQSLLEEPEEPVTKGDVPKKGAAVKKREGDGGKAIQAATANLLEPIFIARGVRNDGFLKDYRRSLQQFLPPLLKNHLVPRVQAMIILGQAASPDAIQLFQTEIANRTQVLWVKLSALEGITNIRKSGAHLGADVESKAGRTIGDFLEKQKELPWPIQMRALEAIGWLRQSGVPALASQAHMANTAMLFLADPDAKTEVRAEAARALGLMQVNAVPRYNFKLVAHYAGLLAADVAAEFSDQYSDNPPRSENPTRAKYLAALLIGPVFQCFDGVQGESNSGILQTGKADTESLKYTQKVFDMVKPLAQASVELLNAPTKEYKARKQTLAARVAELRTFLKENPPPSRTLTERGREYGAGGVQAAAGLAAPVQAAAGLPRGR